MDTYKGVDKVSKKEDGQRHGVGIVKSEAEWSTSLQVAVGYGNSLGGHAFEESEEASRERLGES